MPAIDIHNKDRLMPALLISLVLLVAASDGTLKGHLRVRFQRSISH
jgi:hypothetical protein